MPTTTTSTGSALDRDWRPGGGRRSAVRDVLLVVRPTCFDPATTHAAIALVERHRARLTLVAAVDGSTPWWSAAVPGCDWHLALRDSIASASWTLAATRDEVPAHLPVHHRLLAGSRRPGLQIVDAVRTGGHDALVVSGGRGRLECDGAWLARNSPVPVLGLADPCRRRPAGR